MLQEKLLSFALVGEVYVLYLLIALQFTCQAQCYRATAGRRLKNFFLRFGISVFRHPDGDFHPCDAARVGSHNFMYLGAEAER